MATNCFGDDYNTKFDSEWYLKTYYANPSGVDEEGDFLPIVLEKLHAIFESFSEVQSGRMLDFGTGPNIHTCFSASKVFQDISLAEYAEPNRNAIEKWIKNEKGAHDWMPIMTYIANLEGISGKEVEERTRKAIKEVLPCDVHNHYPLGENKRQPYDLVISSLCLEAACNSKESFNQAVKNVSTLIKTNGHFVLIGVLGETFYKVCDENFFCLSLTKDDIENAVISAGMQILQFYVGVYTPKDREKFNDVSDFEGEKFNDVSNFEGYFVLHAKTSVYLK